MEDAIRFPNLHITLRHVGKSIQVGNFTIAFYGIVIAIAIMVGIMLATREAKRTGQREEDYMDLALYAIIFSVLGARIYYVIFSWNLYKDDLASIFNLRQGGLAIYGAIIGAVITVYVVAKKKQKPVGLMLDTGCFGLVAGQIIGRWGNFFNREVFGGYTNNLLAMQLPVSAVRSSGDITQTMWEHAKTIEGVTFVQVHPTFLYEGLWNLGVLILLFLYRDKKKFDGEIFMLYMGGYALGRLWIEGIRTDQLMIGSVPVSQLLSGILVIAVVAVDIFIRKKRVGLAK
ncbi:MAG: prolipoprotein diacylglyceryl transferase [Lachnospiraceae bacterium]|jgi:phosphatidylglycerol:prolipoprotein diacylglycerol transferase|nr:prolipoprotein diacylglyceryl transferase [Lachnospiraceae bacterium]